MNDLRLDPVVERITVLQKDPETGRYRPSAVYRNDKRKKKGSKTLRPFEKFMRRLSRAQARAASVYNARHDRSNRKKRNGWFRDLLPNMSKAQGQAWKTLRG